MSPGSFMLSSAELSILKNSPWSRLTWSLLPDMEMWPKPPVWKALKIKWCLSGNMVLYCCSVCAKQVFINCPISLKVDWFLPKLTSVLPAAHHNTLSNSFKGSFMVAYCLYLQTLLMIHLSLGNNYADLFPFS